MRRMAKENINTLEYWNGRYTQGDHIWNPENIISRIAGFLRPGQSVLDVAVGSAVVLQGLSRLVPDLVYFGCDLSGRAIERLAGRADLGFKFQALFVHDIREAFPGPRPFADVVISTEMLEHLEDPVGALRNMVELARSKVIVSVPCEDSIRSPEHLWAFNIEDLRAMLQPYGEPWVKYVRRNQNLLGVVSLCRS
jgi:SAM-dependent methyltransferase